MKQIDPQKIYVGTNYHPHDWPRERWAYDLDLMEKSGFTVVRLGHLCWDSFEPEEGVFTFDWMDEVMNLCHRHGIGVFLDIPTRPAPTWLHKKHPSIDIWDKNGIRQDAHYRYMEDVGDPHFHRYAYRLAEVMAKRYKDHPALLAFGMCNELGCGFNSYSPTALERFKTWLKQKYTTVEALNFAWAGHRWSRKLQSFDQIVFPIGGETVGAPERYLDMRRFFSDELVEYMAGLKDTVNRFAPGVPVSANHWAENPQAGFDYNHSWPRLTDYPGQGFYPDITPENESNILGACFCNIHRAAENPLPSWDLEFQVSNGGSYACPPKTMRMYAYLTYALGSQMTVAWTWRAMLGGEEQYLFGLVDHDGTPSWKLDEFAKIAEETRLLNQKNLTYRKRAPEIAVAYSFEDYTVSDRAKDYYSVNHRDQALETYTALYHLNRECALVDPRHIEKPYRVLILPGSVQMTPAIAEEIKKQLNGGATVIMTAYSAKVNEHNQVFDTPLPGLLSEVFGIRVRGFDRAVTHISGVNVGGLEKSYVPLRRRHVTIGQGEDVWMDYVNYHEFMELTTAEPVALYSGAVSPLTTAVSCNAWGKGKAIYVGVPANEALLHAVLQNVCGIGPAFPQLPRGVVARTLREGVTLYVNTTVEEKSFPAAGCSALTDTQVGPTLTLPPLEVEILQNTP